MHKRVKKYLKRLRLGRALESVRLTLVHTRIEDRAVTFCVNMENDPIQRKHRQGFFYEAPELRMLRQVFPRGGTFVDIGANVGNHTLFAAMFMGAARVIPFEPNRAAYDLLFQNVLVNRVQDIVDLQFVGVGLSDAQSGGFAMQKKERNLGSAQMLQGKGKLEVHRGDVLLADVTPDLIKMDVEGMEMTALAGLSGVLARCRPVIMVEVDTKNDDAFQTWCAENRYATVHMNQRYRNNKNYLIADAAAQPALTAKLEAFEAERARKKTPQAVAAQ